MVLSGFMAHPHSRGPCRRRRTASQRLAPSRACKSEDSPALRINLPEALCEVSGRIRPNDLAPEREAGPVRLRDSNDPVSRHAVPQRHGRLPTNARTTIPAKDEELRHVEVVWIVARGRPACGEREARNVTAVFDEKLIAHGWVGPIERQFLVPESTVRPEFDREDLAQIVDVQLQEIA